MLETVLKMASEMISEWLAHSQPSHAASHDILQRLAVASSLGPPPTPWRWAASSQVVPLRSERRAVSSQGVGWTCPRGMTE